MDEFKDTTYDKLLVLNSLVLLPQGLHTLIISIGLSVYFYCCLMRVFTMGNTLKCLQINSLNTINNERNIRNHHCPTTSETNKFPNFNHINNQIEQHRHMVKTFYLFLRFKILI